MPGTVGGATRQLADVGGSCVSEAEAKVSDITLCDLYVLFVYVSLCFCTKLIHAALIIHESTESVVVSMILHQDSFLCRCLLSVKMSGGQLASLASLPSEDKSEGTCQCFKQQSLSTGHSSYTRSVCPALVYPG